MTTAVTLARLLPLAFLGRLATAFAEVSLAAAILSGSVIVGHELRDWRAWYWDPSTMRVWAPTPLPRETVGAAAQPAPAVTASAATASSAAPTPTPPCHPSASGELLAFVNPHGAGADCVWLALRADGTHLIVGTYGLALSDLGIVGMPHEAPTLRVYSPSAWNAPVVVTVGTAGAAGGSVFVFTWQGQSVVQLLRTSGRAVDVAMDATGWPRVSVTSADGAKTFAWDGRTFSAR